MLIFKFNTKIYSKTALMKASYHFTDRAYIHLDQQAQYYIVSLEMKEGNDDISLKEFQNEMLLQSLRHSIITETKEIRQLLLARSMATSMITTEKNEELFDFGDSPFDEKEILSDWFANEN